MNKGSFQQPGCHCGDFQGSEQLRNCYEVLQCGNTAGKIEFEPSSSSLRADLDASQEEYNRPNVAFCVTNSGRVCRCVPVRHMFSARSGRCWSEGGTPRSQKVKKYSSFERMHEPAFGFVCLRPGETELSNKNKSQINYGLERRARRFVLMRCGLHFFPRFQCFDSACLFGGMT